jgi:putative pyruvate formate lyase activating enzyme
MEKLKKMKCYDCPRKCGVDRAVSQGFCGEREKIRVSKIIENFMWEEPCISGEKGALAIFFSGCNLRCKFCQNYEISHIGKGEYYSPKEFLNLLLSFDLTRFSCIDLITPTHFSSLLIEALSDFECPIPIVWNSGGYENVEMIDKLSPIVDVFLPDFKFYSKELSSSLAKASDYFEVASKVIIEMRKNKPQNTFDKDGILRSGVLIRHLVLPNYYNDSIKLLDFLAKNIESPFISLMCQFTPTKNYESRKLVPLEYKAVVAHARKIGLNEGYLQDFSSSSDDFIPEF